MFIPNWSERLCINCMACVKACPTGALTEYNKMPTRARDYASKCTGCMQCVKACPTGAIYVMPVDEKAAYGNWTNSVKEYVYKLSQKEGLLVEGKGTIRKVINLDGLAFKPAQLSKAPLLESEEVDSTLVIGRKGVKQITLKNPIMIGAMSYGSMSREAKQALARGSKLAGTIANTGEGGMLPEERKEAGLLTVQYSTGRFGISDKVLKQADMIEIKIGQGAKPGMGGMLLGSKVSKEIAEVREVKEGETVISPSRHPDIKDKEELRQRVKDLREKYNVPICIKIAGGDVEKDMAVAVYAEPDAIAIDGMEAGTGAAPITAKDHAGMPLVPLLVKAARFLEKKKLKGEIKLIAGGGLRHGADHAKCLALGADAVYVGGALNLALGCVNCRMCHTDTCPVGITTQNPELRKRLDVEYRSKTVANYLNNCLEEMKVLARLAGKKSLRELSREDLLSLDPMTEAVTGIPV